MPILNDNSTIWDERHAIIGDVHYGNFLHRHWNAFGALTETKETLHDPSAIAAVDSFLKWWRPTHIWYNGDEIDTFQVSVFTKDSHNLEGLEEDIEGWKEIVARHRSWFPKTQFTYLLGNHEARWGKWLQAHPAVQWMKGLSWSQMMDGELLSLPIYDYGTRLKLAPNLIITHGDLIGPRAGDAAKKYLDKYKTSGITGHTHRHIIVPNTIGDETLRWAEGGCLCSLKPHYTSDPDWQQGITIVHKSSMSPTKWKMQLVQVHNGVLSFGDEEFS